MGIKKSKIIYFPVLLLAVLISYQIPSQKAIGGNERNETQCFIDISIHMKKFLKKIDVIKPKAIKQKDGTVVINTMGITEYVLRHKKTFDTLKNKLNVFIQEFPNSTWVNDAYILLGAAYLTINLKESIFSQEAIQTYSKIIELDRKLSINPWTKNLLSDLQVSFIFKPVFSEGWMAELNESEIIKVMFARALVLEYLKTKNFVQAEHEVAILKSRSDIIGNSKNIESLNTLMFEWEKHARK